MKIDLFYEIVSQCMINGVRLAAAFFLYRLLSDFVNKKRAFASAVLYLAVLTVLYYIPQILPNLAAYVIAMAAVYIVLIVGDFKKIRLKAFLCITFFALRWLAVGSVSQLMMLINQMTTTLMNNIEIFMTNIPAIIAMFVATEILDPRDTYADASEWETKAKDLAARFNKNFVKYTGNEAGKALVAAGPQL